MHIKSIPEKQRPRERLCQFGPGVLSDIELLAILFGHGTSRYNAIELAQQLLAHFGSLKALFNASLIELQACHGIGLAKYSQIQAAFELAKRYCREKVALPTRLRHSQEAKALLEAELKGYEHEVFAVLFLNNQNQMLRFEILFEGTINQTQVYPREIAKRCLRYNAAAIIMAHNHPSGNPEMSLADIELTQVLKKTLALIDVHLLDHLIVT